MTPLDEATLNFAPGSLMLLNVILGLVMFGIALDLTIDDFRRLLRAPKPYLIGLFSQFIFLPVATFGLVVLFQPPPSLALGMILVAACPGGNVSNFITHHARGDVALSVSLTATATLIAVLMTPFNIAFWGSLYEPAAELVRQTSLNPISMALNVLVLLAVPLFLGMAVNVRRPDLAARLRRPMRIFSLVFFALFIVIALAGNWQNFLDYAGAVFLLVLIHNAVALAGGYAIAFGSGLPEAQRRTVSIETGIQNSGLGLILIFNFFNGLGGMAVVAAWWGSWHIIAGFAAATLYRRRPGGQEAAA
jgi:bile acid:Na+ symporter, BASS family